MFKFLRRIFAGAEPDAAVLEIQSRLRERGIAIENQNRPPPIPGIIQVETVDVISQIFLAEAARQEAEFLSRGMQTSDPLLNIGSANGIATISFPPRRK